MKKMTLVNTRVYLLFVKLPEKKHQVIKKQMVNINYI